MSSSRHSARVRGIPLTAVFLLVVVEARAQEGIRPERGDVIARVGAGVGVAGVSPLILAGDAALGVAVSERTSVSAQYLAWSGLLSEGELWRGIAVTMHQSTPDGGEYLRLGIGTMIQSHRSPAVLFPIGFGLDITAGSTMAWVIDLGLAIAVELGGRDTDVALLATATAGVKLW